MSKPRHECLTIPLWPDAGKALGLGKNSSYAAAHKGEIPTIRIGGRLLVPKAALQRLLESAG
ncbi:MAG: helix-turn-helix domain-containing protein [Candidatus Thiodiazotropha endolucinida]